MSADTGSAAPLVSVVSITYNHENFIRDALDGFVAQETSFPFEVIVADDGSTDATQKIIAEYHDRHPDLIRPILRAENIGIHANLVDALNTARGTYLAMCEGDDYWTDPLKLNKQVEYLESHPDVAVCFHPVRVVWDDGRVDDVVFPPADFDDELTFTTLLSKNFIQTNSAVYRRLPNYDDVPAVMPLDWYLHALHAATGKIAMLPDTMSVYRRHAGGVWADRVIDRPRFLAERSPGQMAMFDAMLDLASGEESAARAIGSVAASSYGEFETLEHPRDLEVTMAAIGHSERIAALALLQQRTVIIDLSDKLQAARRKIEADKQRMVEAGAAIAELRERETKLSARSDKQRRRIRNQRARVERLREDVKTLEEAVQVERERQLGFRIKKIVTRVIGQHRINGARRALRSSANSR